MAQTQPAKSLLYVGTYSVRGSKGIYVFTFHPESGTAQLEQTVSNVRSPSFLSIHPSGRYLYAVNEEDDQGEAHSGSVNAYAIDPSSGQLTFINQQLSHGQAPCHISIDRSGKLAFVSNYGSGSLAVFPILENGGLGEASQVIQHTGSGVDTERQDAPHVHSAVVSVDNRLLYVSDLGSDQIYIYQIDHQQGKLTANATPYVAVSAGSGARMTAVHPGDAWIYGIKEMSSTVTILRRDRQTNTVELVEDDVSFLPETYSGERSGADIHLDAEGHYLYVTNRGNNTVAIFSVGEDGRLTHRYLHYTGGNEPRNFLLDDPSQYMLAAHQQTDTITIFKRDASSGDLKATGDQIAIPSPVCLLMLHRS
ncbi:6-phosphogluconolactonase [Larkinella arboricola]|uniref:6-phosphogluconolactonase n=1 Tax=Larkinella arboricola TaxID=643671 RepID=A0A327WNJ2_LARAB|nr:lactonase family protein [Larkinella arboricola]RAJ93074.1 6-phosphogluconolactonase [Larkinella arboricola]